ncbi:MAG: adenylate kinase [Aigarchaeota archaeon]|nr:adenylate kinase [Aigarchaeota archaeon]MDW8093261.1 adenylate kinase [Nitrososphaerota archaeon]
MVKVVVLAIPGAGKTTILRRLAQERSDLRVVNFGDMMFETAKTIFNIDDRDQMRVRLKLPDYRKIQLNAAENIARMGGVVIVDTHAVIKTPYGYYPGLPIDVARRIEPDSIVFMEFDPSDILARRNKDAALGLRDRGGDVPEEIEEHQRIAKEFAISASNASSCYFLSLNFRYKESYPFQHVDDAARQLNKHIEELLGVTS